jgi:caffeoyl-CoA O-methyltransferase
MLRAFAVAGVSLLIIVPLSAQRKGGGRMAPSDAATPPISASPAEKKVLDTINDIVRSADLYANVPAADGRLLRILTEAANAKHVVEIGTSTGISGLWFCLALTKTGGKLTTFEVDRTRALAARKHFREAGVDAHVTVVEGDAHQNVTKIRDPIDVLFIDADKDGYLDYLTKLLPLVRPGGLILAHNTDMVPDYMKAVTSRADLETIVYTSGGGLAVTLRKR